MNESQTRKDLIDKRLAEAGWRVNDVTHVLQGLLIEKSDITIPTQQHGNNFPDYALFGKEEMPLIVIGAKEITNNTSR